MKLVRCPLCEDVFSLRYSHERSCVCGSTRGRYLDPINVEYTGPPGSKVIGMRSTDLCCASAGEPGQRSSEYGWWVIGDWSEKVNRKK